MQLCWRTTASGLRTRTRVTRFFNVTVRVTFWPKCGDKAPARPSFRETCNENWRASGPPWRWPESKFDSRLGKVQFGEFRAVSSSAIPPGTSIDLGPLTCRSSDYAQTQRQEVFHRWAQFCVRYTAPGQADNFLQLTNSFGLSQS